MPAQEFNKAEELISQLKNYINTEIELVKLTFAEKVSKIFSQFIAVLLVGVIFLFFIIFFSVALGYLLGQWLGQMWIGFLIIAVLYLLIGIITWLLREKLIRIPIMNAIIRQLFSKEYLDKK